MGKKELEFFRPSRQHNFNRQYLMEGLVEFSRVGSNLDISLLNKGNITGKTIYKAN